MYFTVNGTDNPFINQFVPVGTLKIRFLRTKITPCDNTFKITDPICHKEIYNSENAITQTNKYFPIFNSASENGIDSIVRSK